MLTYLLYHIYRSTPWCILADLNVLAKNFIHEVVRVMVVMAVDYPILCGLCTNINILLFSGNKNNVINCHLLFVLECRCSLCHCDRLGLWVFSVCKVCFMKKMVLKVWYDNIKSSEKKKMDITFSAGQTENKTTVAEYKNMAHIYLL